MIIVKRSLTFQVGVFSVKKLRAAGDDKEIGKILCGITDSSTVHSLNESKAKKVKIPLCYLPRALLLPPFFNLKKKKNSAKKAQ